MGDASQYIKIKDKEIPVIIRNYKKSKNIRIYFKGNILNISKPKSVKNNNIIKLIKENEEQIYNQYTKILSTENKNIKHWNSGEKIFYKGEKFDITREQTNTEIIEIKIEKENKKIKVYIPSSLKDEEDIKKNVDKGIKQLFKNNTGVIIQERLPYWSKITGIEYKTFKVRDAISKFGSCIPSKKALYFSSRLVMLPQNVIDAIIVHELCHIIHANHSKDFYDLVKKYITNYDEIDKWLKRNGNLILM